MEVPAATVFATVVEDLPYASNLVTARSGVWDDVGWEYVPSQELRERSHSLLQRFSAAAERYFEIEPRGTLGTSNLGHACGTCRFGSDPRTSVLDRNNRAHDLDNLYVVDASFFPSSGGIQPSLTIAANSLRVGGVISRRL
jgi:choline dehydrogenase-like flavoprotein